MPNFNSVKSCRHGMMAFNIHDQYVGRSFELYGEFSQGEVDVFDAILSPGDFVIDAGANIGAHTVYFAKKGCTVLAFEPQRLVFQLLCANMAINSIPNAYCYNLALGDEYGSLMVPELNPEEVINWGGLSIEGHEKGDTVPVAKLDDYGKPNGIPSCKLIKIDVEGMEEKVLRGAIELINEYKPVLYVENDREEKSESLLAYIKELGYITVEHKPPLYNPNNYYQVPTNVFENIVSSNLICVHEHDVDTMAAIMAAL